MRELGIPSLPGSLPGAYLGIRVQPGVEALGLAAFAHDELGVRHFVACLAGETAPTPSELLKSLGVSDADFAALFLAEHVPGAG